jgi:hypothetical protein
MIINCRLFSNLRGLLQAYLAENLEGLGPDQATLEFAFLSENDIELVPSSGLILRGLRLVCGMIEGGSLTVDRMCRTVEPFPDVLVNVVRIGAKVNKFMCPLFRTLRVGGEKGEYLDGQPEDLIWQVPLKTENTQIELVANGTCLVCELPASWDSNP